MSSQYPTQAAPGGVVQQPPQQQPMAAQQQAPPGQHAAGAPTQGAPPAGPPEGQQEQAKPGFFSRMFGRKPPADAAGGDAASNGQPAAGAGQPPVVDAPNAAKCCAKNWSSVDEQNAQKLMESPLLPSRFKFLQPPGQGPSGPQGPSWNPNASPTTAPPGITSTPQAGEPLGDPVHGPFLRFGGYDATSHVYYVSVLMLVHQTKGVKPPELRFRDVNMPKSETSVAATHLDHYRGYNFWRFDLAILCGAAERTVEYMVVLPRDHAFTYQNRHCFFVPGVSQKWRWGFYSCNGFDNPKFEPKMGGIQPLWRDVLHCHEEKPMHIMIGGGDQLYNDPVWNLEALVEWLQVPDMQQRLACGFTQKMAEQVEWFYMTSYMKHWAQPLFRDAMAGVPQIMMWDDHDIFDGWGSYPPALQHCPVFQGVFYMARKFFTLFQQHSTPQLIHQQNHVFGEYGWNWVGCLGSTTAVLIIDSRTERSREFIVRPTSWTMIQQKLAELPGSIKHVVVVATVPLIYPQIPIVESSMEFLTGQGRTAQAVTSFMQKTGLSSALYNAFGEVEILDDLTDHWSAKVHETEKRAVVEMLQDMAQARSFRFTFLSGDVHVGGLGRFFSEPKTNLRYDHRFMPQIISSAIGNRPPPNAVVKALNRYSGDGRFKTSANSPQHTKEAMLKVFEGNSALVASRNWCLVDERDFNPGSPGCDGSLNFQLRIERPKAIAQRPMVVDIPVPTLEGMVRGFANGRLRPFALAGVVLPPMHVPQFAQQPAAGDGAALGQQQQQQGQGQLDGGVAHNVQIQGAGQQGVGQPPGTGYPGQQGTVVQQGAAHGGLQGAAPQGGAYGGQQGMMQPGAGYGGQQGQGAVQQGAAYGGQQGQGAAQHGANYGGQQGAMQQGSMQQGPLQQGVHYVGQQGDNYGPLQQGANYGSQQGAMHQGAMQQGPGYGVQQAASMQGSMQRQGTMSGSQQGGSPQGSVHGARQGPMQQGGSFGAQQGNMQPGAGHVGQQGQGAMQQGANYGSQQATSPQGAIHGGQQGVMQQGATYGGQQQGQGVMQQGVNYGGQQQGQGVMQQGVSHVGQQRQGAMQQGVNYGGQQGANSYGSQQPFVQQVGYVH